MLEILAVIILIPTVIFSWVMAGLAVRKAMVEMKEYTKESE